MNDNGTFCVLAWDSIGMNPHGRVRACGKSIPNSSNPSLRDLNLEQAWNSDYYKQLRLDMLNGIRNSNCKKCFVQEDLNGTSSRQKYIKDLEIFDINHYRSITNSDGSLNNPPKKIDIRVGNICNLKCVHCWTGNSSKWFEDKLLLDKYENTTSYDFENSWVDEIFEYVKNNATQIEWLNLLGGEPFASKSHNQFIDWCIKTDNTHFNLTYVTNATLLNKKLIDTLNKFRKVQIGISLDAINEQAELLRFPTNWKNTHDKLLYINDNFSFAYFNWTCYNLNFNRLLETMEFCEKNYPNIPFKFGDYVINPTHMSVQNLPLDYKMKLLDKLKNIKDIDFYLNYMMEDHTWDNSKHILLNYLEDLDKTRKTNWRLALPEIAELYE